MKLTRRGLFGVLAGAITAPFLPIPNVSGGILGIVLPSPSIGTIGGITRSDCSFWRNQQGTGKTTPFDRETLTRIYNDCTVGGNYLRSPYVRGAWMK